MNVYTFRDNTLGLLNSLVLAAEVSTPESWPANRDQVLQEWGCTSLNFLTLEDPTE